MQLFTDRTVEILTDVCAWTFVLTAASILIALTFDAVEELLERVRRAADRHRSARRLKPTRAWRSQRGAVAVEFALITPVFCLLIIGGAVLHLALQDVSRLETAVQNGAKAGAARLLTIDEAGNVERHDGAAVALATAIYMANAPGGASAPIVEIVDRTVRVSGQKEFDFMGWLPARTAGVSSEAYAVPEKGGA